MTTGATPLLPDRIALGLTHVRHRLVRGAVERLSVPPPWLGYAWMRRESLREHVARTAGGDRAGGLEVIHAAAVAEHPLPRNVRTHGELTDETSWWGFAFRDVPHRRTGETVRAVVRGCRVLPHVEANGQFYVAIVTPDDRSLALREIAFRAGHAPLLRSAPVCRLERATWVTERVFHNYAHWLTGHLPKFVVLRDRGELSNVLLPRRRPPFVDASLRLLGMDPEQFTTFENETVLEVEELTVLDTDRFRPELLRLARDAFAPMVRAGDVGRAPPLPGGRRVFLSRAGARLRRLIGEDELWAHLEPEGFERVRMEELSFADQVRLMRETAVLLAPHGAGLANMIFARPGTAVIELVNPLYPSPNFYAMAAGLGHPYWLVTAEAVGAGAAGHRDLRVNAADVMHIVRQALVETGTDS